MTGELSLGGQPEQLVDDTVLCEDILLGDPLDLAFAEHVYGFIALDRPLRRGKRSKPQPMVDAAFDKPMILFHDIIQILILSESAGFWDGPLLLKNLERWGVRRIVFDGDDTREGHMARAQDFTEKPRCGLAVSSYAQHEVDGVPLGIDGTVQVAPLLLNLDVGFIDAV